MLDRLQDRDAIEILVWDLRRIIITPCGELTAGSAAYVKIRIPSFIGDVDNADLALGADSLANVIRKSRALYNLAQDEDFVPLFQLQLIVHELADDRGRASPHVW